MRILATFFYLLLFYVTQAQQTLINNQLPQLMGVVHGVYQRGDTLLLGGNFTRAYLNDSVIQYGGAVDTGSLAVQFPWACPNGPVTAVISDKQGGFIIAGSFGKVGDSLRSNIARLDSNGKVTVTFSDIAVNGIINRMQLVNDTLFMVGSFKGVDQSSNVKKGSIGMLGKDTSYSGILEPEFSSSCAIPDGKGGWFIAGNFNSRLKLKQPTLKWIDSLRREYDWRVYTNQKINTILKIGDSLFIGGDFTAINGVSRNGLALIRISTLEVMPWNPSPNGTVNTIVSYKNRIFIGGSFGMVGDSSRGMGASFDSAGNITQWNPMAQGFINCMIPYKNTMIVGGGFYSLRNTIARRQLGAVDLDSGYATSWNPVTVASNNGNAVNSLAIVGSNLFVGTDFFELLNPGPGNSLRVFNLTNGIERNWNILPNGPVYSLQHWNGKILFGGSFTEVNNKLYNNIALIDTNGVLTPFSWSAESSVNLIVSDGNHTMISGEFKGFTRSRQCYIAAIQLSTSTLIPFNFNINNTVSAFAKAGNLIYIGGAFTKVNNQIRSRFAEISLPNQQLTALVKNFDEKVACLTIKDSTIFCGGLFYSVNDTVRKHLAAINRFTHKIAVWNPVLDYVVEDMVVSNDHLFIGGGFNYVGNYPRKGLAKINCTTGALSDWSPDGDYTASNRLILFGSNLINGFLVPTAFDTGTAAKKTFNINCWINDYLGEYHIVPAHSGNKLYLGGVFEGMNNWDTPRNGGLIAISASTGKMLPINFGVNRTVYDLKGNYYDKNRVHLVGSFNTVLGGIRWYAADINLDKGTLGFWNPSETGPIYALAQLYGRVYIGKNGILKFVDQNDANGMGLKHDFSGYGVSLNNKLQYANGKMYVAANAGHLSYIKVIDVNTLLTIKSIPLNGEVRTFQLRDSLLYVGGEFTTIAGVSRNFCAAIHINHDTILPVFSKLFINAPINAISIINNKMYLGGNFTYINGYRRGGLAMLDIAGEKLTNWTADANGTVEHVYATTKGVFVSGSFSEVKGIKRSGLVFIDQSPLGTVSLTLPSLHQSNIPLATTLSWSTVEGTGVQYQYEVDTNRLFNSPVKRSGVVTQNTIGQSFRFNTTYFWRVRFIRQEADTQLVSVNDTSEWSDVYDFTTLPYPALALPAFGTLLPIDSSFFQTHPVPGVTGVQMRIDTAGGSTIALQEMSPASDTFVMQVHNLIPAKTYQIAIRGYHSHDTSQWNTYTFLTNPGIVLISPSHLSDSNSVNINFSFIPGFVNRAQSFLVLDTSPSFTSPMLITKAAIQNTVLQKHLRFATRYFWKIMQTKGQDTLAVSAVWSFRNDSFLIKPTSPLKDERSVKVVPTFIKWKPMEEFTAINYQMDTNRLFMNPIDKVVQNEAGIDSVIGLLPETSWYIRMRGLHTTDTAYWGEVIPFNTDARYAAAPALIKPLHVSTVVSTDSVEFSWEPAKDAVSYKLQVGLTPNLSNTVFQANTSNALLRWKLSLSDTTYYWRVIAVVPGKEGTWSVVNQFKLYQWLPIPQALRPDSNQHVAPKMALLWDSIPAMLVYEYQLATQPTFLGAAVIRVMRSRSDSITPNVNTTYYWRVRSVQDTFYSAWSYTAVFNTYTTGVKATQDTKGIHIYPNPVSGVLQVSLEGGAVIDELMIYDPLGYKWMELNQSSAHTTLNVSALPPGVYLIQIKSKRGYLVSRFIKR